MTGRNSGGAVVADIAAPPERVYGLISKEAAEDPART